VSCLLGVSHVLGGLGGRSAALKWQHRRRQERPSVGAASWLPASLHAAITTPCECWTPVASGIAWLAAAAVAAVLATGLEVAGSVGCCKVAAAATGGRCSAADQRTCPAQAAGIAVCDAVNTAPHGGLERVAVVTLLGGTAGAAGGWCAWP
jgi:hypothetical protein